MALIETTLNGETVDRVKRAIEWLRFFEPKDGSGYYLAYSGGKDSDVCLRLLEMSGCKFDAHYNVTGVDPAELVRHVCRDHPEVQIHKPDKSMWTLIAEKKMPPTRLARYCCEHLKEAGGFGRAVVTGVRWAESNNRRVSQGKITVVNQTAKEQREMIALAKENGAEYRITEKGGIILNYDNDETRNMLDVCIRTRKTMINPIVEWSDTDVWEFIKREHIKYCELYDQGFSRLGCIGCPLGGYASQIWEFNRFPGRKRQYIKAFDRMLKEREKAGKPNTTWKTGEDVFRWWTGQTIKNQQVNGQISLLDFDVEEIRTYFGLEV